MLLLGKQSSIRCANSPSFLSLPHIHTWNKLVNVSDSSFKNTTWLVLFSVNTTLVQILRTSHLNNRKASNCRHGFSIQVHSDHTLKGLLSKTPLSAHHPCTSVLKRQPESQIQGRNEHQTRGWEDKSIYAFVPFIASPWTLQHLTAG